MKKKVTATMSSILSIIGIGAVVCALIIKPQNEILEPEEFITLFLTTLFCLSTLLYIKWTDFGNLNQSEINKIESENQLLKKQIEQKELRTKLENII